MNNDYNNTNRHSVDDAMSENEKLNNRIAELEKKLAMLMNENESLRGTEPDQNTQVNETKEMDAMPITDEISTFYKLSEEEMSGIIAKTEHISATKPVSPITDFQIEEDKGKYSIVGYIGSGGDVVIPDGITSIGEEAFLECASINSVTVPYSVESIGSCAFLECENLVSINVDSRNANFSSLDGVLYNKSQTQLIVCPDAKTDSLNIPVGVSIISDGAFENCTKLKSITIPNSVTIIGYGAFTKCMSLTSIVIPSSVKRIDEEAFASCDKLVSATILGQNVEIAYDAFVDCAYDEVKDNYNLTIYGYPGSSVEQYAREEEIPFEPIDNISTPVCSAPVPEEKTSSPITDFVIEHQDGETVLKKYLGKEVDVIIPNGITIIDKKAFDGCANIVSVTIPASVVYFDYVSILECCNLERINVVDENSVYSSINGVLYSKDKTLLCYCPNSKEGTVSIPDTVSEIGGAAFSYCKNLKSVVLPNSVEKIGECAFGFSNISSISIPNSVKSVGKMAFSYCENLSSVTVLGNSVRFDDMVFEGCENLTICSNIGSTAEQYAKKYSIPFKALDSNIEQPVFEPISNKNPSSPLTDFKIKSVKGEMVLKKYLGNSESVLIPEIVTKIGDSAFFTYITKKIKDVTIVGGVKSIGISAFACCYNLERVSILDSVISIGNLAFNACWELKKVTLPDTLISIGNEAFGGCKELANINIPNGTETIGAKAFKGCKNLTSITIPYSVSIIGRSAFAGCNILTIRCYSGSTAHRYAEENGIAYQIIG